MSASFPSQAWVEGLGPVLNGDDRDGRIARNWEGALLFVVKPDGAEEEGPSRVYLDLWHGKCRSGRYLAPRAADIPKPAFPLSASLGQFQQILKGELDPMQAD